MAVVHLFQTLNEEFRMAQGVKKDTLASGVFRPINTVYHSDSPLRLSICHCALLFLKKGPIDRAQPRKATVTERNYVSLENDIRKMQLLLQY